MGYRTAVPTYELPKTRPAFLLHCCMYSYSIPRSLLPVPYWQLLASPTAALPEAHVQLNSPRVKFLPTCIPMSSPPSFSSPLLYLPNDSFSSFTSQCAHRKRPEPRNTDSGEAAHTAQSAGRETVPALATLLGAKLRVFTYRPPSV